MQQYRVNFTLLIGLVVGTLVSSGAVYGLWKFQTKRRSNTLIVEAQKAQDEGKLSEAVKLYSQYVRIRPGDSEQRVKFAEACADLAEKFDAAMEERRMAINVMEATVRELPNEKGVRLRLAKLYVKLNVTKDAIEHLNFVADDPEAQLLRASLLMRQGNLEEAIPYSYKLIGYDPKTDTFDAKREGAVPNDPATYLNLAVALRKKEDQQALADRVMDQAVLANPDSAAAHLALGQYLHQYGEVERGIAEFEAALRLGPEDANVLSVLAQQAAEAKDYEKAREFVVKGKKLHPKDVRFYQLGSALFSLQDDWKGALAEVDEGLKQIPPPAGYELMLRKVEIQIGAKDYANARKMVGEMKLASIRPEICEWFEARILLAEEKWFQANQLLVGLRPRLSGETRLSAELNYALGLSYQKLGQHELAIRAFDELLKLHPDNEPAKYSRQQSKLQGGLAKDVGADDPLQRALRAELDKPKAEQNWTAFQAQFDKVAADRELDETSRKWWWGQVLLARQEFGQAQSLAAELFKTAPEDGRVQQFVLDSIRFDTAPGQGPAKALGLMERMKLKDQPRWRLYKAGLFLAMDDEQTRPQLASLLTNLDAWTAQEKVQLWTGMADLYLSSNLRMQEEARRCLMLVTEVQPDDLQTWIRLFGLALDSNDDESAKAAQDAILKIVKSENDPSWLYVEARRRMWLMRRGRQGPEGIAQVRKLLERALEGRPQWYDLYALSAEVELMANNFAAALKHLDQAESLGRLSPTGVAKHIQLLAADGQLARAAEKLESIPEDSRAQLLGDLYTELLFRTRKIDDAIKTARAQSEANPENPQLLYRYGQLLARSTERPDISVQQKKSDLALAVAALEKAVKLQPEFADAWYSLILFNAMSENQEKAQQALRDIQLSLSGDSLQFVLAKCYEALGRWFDAEPMYRSVYEADPENIERAQQLAAFYAGAGYRQRDARDKMAPLINQILRAGADGRIPASDRNLLWARRTAARILASTGDYQQVLKAEKMLRSNSQDGSLPVEDRLEMAQILARRPEPESRRIAMQLLEEVDQLQPLNADTSLILGNLYFAAGDWNATRRQFLRSFERFPNSAPLRMRFASMLIGRGNPADLKLAEEYVGQLRKLAPNTRETLELTALLAIKTGNEKMVLQALVGQLPPSTDPKAISDEQVTMLELHTNLYIQLKEYDRAEQILRLLVKRDPQRVLTLAQFLGSYRDVAQCFDLLDAETKPEQLGEVVRVGVSVIRARRREIGDKFDARVEAWIDRGLRTNGASVPLLIAKAEFLEVQRKYPEASAVYRELLSNPDVVGVARAVVLNNLSFLMALANTGDAGNLDPLRLVQEAADILGPTADILDTRAVVLTARKQYDRAIQDLELSVTDNPTAAKYFHKSVAHLRNGQNKAAIDSWTEAEKRGLLRETLHPLEVETYEALKSQIEKLRAGGA